MSNEQRNGLPPGWAWTTLGEVVDVLDSRRIPINSTERATRSGNVPYYGATGQVGWINDYIFDEELILLGEDGAPFLEPNKPKAYMIRGKAWVNNHAHVLNGVFGISNHYVLHQLNKLDYRPFVSGTTRLKLPQAPMRLMPIVVAPASEQHRIVEEIEKQFSRLEAATEALKRTAANLKRLRAATLKAACEGRLVATEAALARVEGRDYEPAEQLLQRILRERRTRWEAYQLAKMQGQGKPPKDDKWKANYAEPAAPAADARPALPEGWTWATIEAFSSIIVDCPHSTPSWTSAGHICIRTTNFKPGYLDLSEIRYVSTTTYQDRIERLKPTCGDVLYSREGGILGIACVVPSGVELCMGQRMMLMRVSTGLPPAFLMHVLNSPPTLALVKRLTGGSASPHLNVGEVKRFAVPLPPLAEQQRIVAEVERRLSVIDKTETVVRTNLKRAATLRQRILQHAFTGKLVAQDPTDEPANELLERIRAEKLAREQSTKAVRQPQRKKPTRERQTKATQTTETLSLFAHE